VLETAWPDDLSEALLNKKENTYKLQMT
jgi:hypothetical protein